MAKDLFPVVDEAWDSEAAVNRWRKYVSSDGSGNKEKIDWERYQNGFMWHDEKDKENFTSYKLPFVDLIDGNPKAIKKAISSVRGAISGARGGVDISEEDQKKVMRKVEQYEKKMDQDSKKKLESMLRFAVQTDQSELLNKLMGSTKALVSKTSEFQTGLFELNDQLNEAKAAGIDITDVSLLLDNITDLLGSTYDNLKSVVDELSSGETGRAFLLAP